jgi:hypothetical protein
MKPRIAITLTGLALALLVSLPAHAQQPAFDFKVPFDFVAAGRTFKAGEYVLASNSDEQVFALEPKNAAGDRVLLPVETRIAANSAVREPQVVFDRANGRLSVSELLLPDGDGYLFLITKGKHTHEKVAGTRRKG